MFVATLEGSNSLVRRSPAEIPHRWNKASAIWFPHLWRGSLVVDDTGAPKIGQRTLTNIRGAIGFILARLSYSARTRARGEDRLSDKNVGEPNSPDTKKKKKSASESRGAGRNRGQRTGDIGRALRSVYDETLRENVPDDFLNLLGKLS